MTGRHELTLDVQIPAAPQAVWKVLTDFRRLPEWMANVTAVHLATKGAARRGTKMRFMTQAGSHQLESEIEVDVCEAPSELAWSHTSSTLDGEPFEMMRDGRTAFRLQSTKGGTRLAVNVSFVAHGLKATLGAGYFVKHSIKPRMEESLQRLKALVG